LSQLSSNPLGILGGCLACNSLGIGIVFEPNKTEIVQLFDPTIRDGMVPPLLFHRILDSLLVRPRHEWLIHFVCVSELRPNRWQVNVADFLLDLLDFIVRDIPSVVLGVEIKVNIVEKLLPVCSELAVLFGASLTLDPLGKRVEIAVAGLRTAFVPSVMKG